MQFVHEKVNTPVRKNMTAQRTKTLIVLQALDSFDETIFMSSVVENHFHLCFALSCLIRKIMIYLVIFYSANSRRHFSTEFGLILLRFECVVQNMDRVL